MENAYELLKTGSRNQADKWIKTGFQSVRLLKKILKKPNLTTGEKNKLLTTVSSLMSIIENIKHLQRRGGSIAVRRKIADRIRWVDLDSVFQGRIRTGTIVNLVHKDLISFLNDAKTTSTKRLTNALRNHGNLKVNVVLACKFSIMKNGELIEETKFFNTRNERILPATDIPQWFNENVIDRLLIKVEDFQERDSGWTMREILNLVVNMNRYDPIRGGFSTFVELPVDVQEKKAVVNIKNRDEFCFLWAVTAALNLAKDHVDRPSSYPHYSSVLKYEGINFPIALKDVSKFEKLNNLSINVYGIEKSKKNCEIVPLYSSVNKSDKSRIHLFMIESDTGMQVHNEENYQAIYHFPWIRNLSRLLSAQVTNYNQHTWIRDNCLNHFKL